MDPKLRLCEIWRYCNNNFTLEEARENEKESGRSLYKTKANRLETSDIQSSTKVHLML